MNTEDHPADPRPIAPHQPEPGECCQSGCEPCVYDRYDAALDRFEAALRAWKRRQAGNSQDAV